MLRELRAGVIGAGVFGGFHANKYAAAEDVRLSCVFDLDVSRAKRLADRFGAATAKSIDEFLDRVDVVTIASPAESHFALGRAALAADRHVYVEKPLAMQVDDANALVRLAGQRGKVLFVGHQERLVLDAIGLFGSNERPIKVEFSRCGPSSGRCEEVSVVWDLMIHDLDLAARLGCGRPVDVRAAGSDHEAMATIDFENDCVASFLASRRCSDRRRMMTAHYPDGVVTVDFLSRSLTSTRPDGVLRQVALGAALDDPLGANVSKFLACVQGDESCGVAAADGADSIALAAFVDGAIASVNAGQSQSGVGLEDAARRLSA
ncbi:MAG: Gfo/Idh/MocA family oxidoreductase [Pseudomonadota bacterium]